MGNNPQCVKDTFECASMDSDCMVGFCQGDGTCSSRARPVDNCPDSTDPCMNMECGVDGTCIETPVVCNSPDFCHVGTCEAGQCVVKDRVCSTDLCMISECDVNALDFDSACPTAVPKCSGCESCSALTGRCVDNGCDDGIMCTVDECTNDQCVNTPVDDKRASVDPCKEPTCNPTHPDADPRTGCVVVAATCADDGDYCSVESCKAFDGCVADQRDCRSENLGVNTTVDSSNGKNKPAPVVGVDDCDLHYCDSADGGKCVMEEKACVAPFGTTEIIVTAALGTAAVVGIVVGIVVAVALCAGGAGVYSVYKNVDDGADAVIANNPLYEKATAGGDNPLWDAGQ